MRGWRSWAAASWVSGCCITSRSRAGRSLVLLEKGELTSGSTWHAAGQCPHFIGSLNAAKLHVYGTQLYSSLEEKTGQAVSWHTTGGLRLACTDEEVNWFRQVLGVSKLAGYEAHIIGPNEIPRYHPFLDVTGVKAAFLTVTDGHVAPADATMAMAAGARARGAEIYRRTRVTDISRLETGEWLVTTDHGELRCEHVVNAAGSYCNEVASWTAHRAPIANMLHHYLITEPVAPVAAHTSELPVVRDPWAHAYFRKEGDSILVGPYETSGAHECWDGPPAWDFEGELVAPELDRLLPQLERAGERFPLFAQSGIKRIVSGAIPHTPDGAPLSGPAPGAPNYWMHCGASLGIGQGAGISRFLAQWMAHGQPEISVREFDPRRFGDWTTPDVTRAVGIADYQHMYYCYKPAEQHDVGRDLRRSSVHDALKACGAQFSQVFGWERARWCRSHAPRRALFVQTLQLVGGRSQRVPGRAPARRADGPVQLREVRDYRAGRCAVPGTDLSQPSAACRWPNCTDPPAQSERFHR